MTKTVESDGKVSNESSLAEGTPAQPERSFVDTADNRPLTIAVSNTPHVDGPGDTVLPIEQILAALKALKRGDFDVRLTGAWTGPSGQLATVFNELAQFLAQSTDDLMRISRVVATEGKLQERLGFAQATAGWAERINSVNALLDGLAQPVIETARVIDAVAKGELSRDMPLDIDGRRLEGDFLRAAETVNRMVNQLRAFASEVTRVAREVGMEGKLGGQAKVEGAAGAWKDLTDSVNSMAGNLTAQVRNITEVTTAVANGDLTQKITVDVKGEILELKNTVNGMVDRLSAFAGEITRVAHEVGVEGKLGGQASVDGPDGTWKDLTQNVNRLAANLTTQVRAIAQVATAVAQGDITRFIDLDAGGEVAALRDNINQVIGNLRETTRDLEQRVIALMDVNRELEAFNYSISHDLRAPLRSMSGFAEALYEQQSAKNDPETFDYARRIRRAALHMDNLLQDLLAYSRLSRTEMPLIPVSVEVAVNEILAGLETEIQKNGGTVELVPPLGMVLAHPPTLRQMLANLIDNAIKFIASGRPLRLRIFASPQSGSTRIWVEDNGIGIAREYHEKIFGLFQRLHGTDKYPGTGVGLALVHRGAERMGGRAGLQSQPGQGSSFWIELPTPETPPENQ